MRPGKRPKPSHLKVITGNPGKRALPTAEPRPRPSLPEPPDHLNADALEEWQRVAPLLFQLGLLTAIDRGTLAAMCQAYGRWIQAERALLKMAGNDPLTGGLLMKTSNGNAIQSPLVGTANKAAADYVRYATEFGLTPSARSRVEADRLIDPSHMPPTDNSHYFD